MTFIDDLVDGMCGVIFSAIALIAIIFTCFQIEGLSILSALPVLIIWTSLFLLSLGFTIITFINYSRAGILQE